MSPGESFLQLLELEAGEGSSVSSLLPLGGELVRVVAVRRAGRRTGRVCPGQLWCRPGGVVLWRFGHAHRWVELLVVLL
jgi:hypothetical protein